MAGRSAAQLSGYVDLAIASFLAVGTLAALSWAQRLYLLPIALFGLSIAAVELPELSRLDPSERGRRIPERFDRAWQTAAFLLAPTLVGFLGFGFVAVGVLYRGGRFGLADNWLVYLVLAAYTLGLPATVASRLLQNVFFSLGNTRRPARVAFVRLAISAALGGVLAFRLDTVPLSRLVEVEGATALTLAPVGLALASAVAAWVEIRLLLRPLRRSLPELRVRWAASWRPLAASLAGAVPAAAVWWLSRAWPVLVGGLLSLAVLAGAYLALAAALEVPGRVRLVGLLAPGRKRP